ncbi:MAG: arsenite S-adenosylmethyltransferase [Bacteroidetes bacterium HGW-Bacteroidetes-6]|jgi:ubiquinone/menaquinone biosynthesis C-methylase UbiE|nr:MAG: arsenite S-adenosylmethyltransferase [Bacteroidetes bacterium HGW-Bacteroidetes-6]
MENNKKNEELSELVREKYSAIVNESSGCGCNCGDATTYSIFSDDYTKLEGYNPDADLNLGCGIPTEFAHIKAGDTVIDLGSGAGNDCFVARSLVGETGMVIGIDMTPAMVGKANENIKKLGFRNVQFRLGQIEKMPVTSNKADVIISNCVLNLVPDKMAAFREMSRVLKPGGHFSVSDIVLSGPLPESILKAAELYAGCVAGASLKTDYLKMLEDADFINIRIDKEKVIELSDELLKNYMNEAEIAEFRATGSKVLSVNVYGEKRKSLCCCCGG